jgi:hypothetical protein
VTGTPPAQRPVEPARTLLRDSGPAALYAGVLRHLAGRAAVLLASASLRLTRWATARDRAVPPPGLDLGLRPCLCGMGDAADRDHKQGCRRRGDYDRAMARLSVLPGGYAQGRADLQFTHHAGHGASEGDPDL